MSKHLASVTLAKLDSGALADYVARRKAEGAGNRTVNIEVGVLRRVLKQYRMWQFVSDGYKAPPEPKDVGRALSPEQELRVFSFVSTRTEWSVAFSVSLIAANTTAGGCELRNVRLRDIDIGTKTLCVRVGKNRFRVTPIPLNRTATGAVERLLHRAQTLGTTDPEHYLIPRRIRGKPKAGGDGRCRAGEGCLRQREGELTHHPRMGATALESCCRVTTENRRMRELRRCRALCGNLLECLYCLPRNGSKILARVEQILSRCVPA